VLASLGYTARPCLKKKKRKEKKEKARHAKDNPEVLLLSLS
jgi:hypothetical protein